METILRGYHVDDPTWFYLSFLLIVAVYFKFNRFWSVRNLDLALLLAISPGLLLVRAERSIAAVGYGWLFAVSAAILVRVLVDGQFVRRPRLDQNMNAAGMMFLCGATFLFLTTKLLTDPPEATTVESIRHGTDLIEVDPLDKAADPETTPAAATPAGPGASLVVNSLAQLSKVVTPRGARSSTDPDVVAARFVAIFAHLAVIVGLALVGRHIFGDSDVGVAMATLYMLLPCTAFDVGKVNHVLPAAAMVWAIWAYRRPFVSGLLLGLACAMLFFPVFLLPLWIAFYARSGGWRFSAAVVVTALVIVSSLLFMSSDWQALLRQTLASFDWINTGFWSGRSQAGFWKDHDEAYRIPVFVSYVVMLVALTIWPRRKSLAQVMTHSAALVIGTEFWYPQQGGVYVLWYLPLLLLVVFRPHMTNHFAPEHGPLPLVAWLGARRNTERKLVGAATASPAAS